MADKPKRRTNAVYLNGGPISQIKNFPFKKVYHGTRIPLEIDDEGDAIIDGPFFVTPYQSIACIFVARRNTEETLPPETKGAIRNISYEEWSKPSNEILSKVTEYVEYMDDTHFDDIVSHEKGYLYEFDVDDYVKEHVFQSAKMTMQSKTHEYCIDHVSKLKVAKTTPLDIELTIKPRKYVDRKHRPFSESYIPDDATSGTSDFDEKDDDPEDCFVEYNIIQEGCDNMSLSEFDQYFQEYTSSKQRNRQKKFLKEKNFVPDKDNPKTGTIDSTEIDPKTGKPIRVKFSYDNEKINNLTANASGTDFIHMNERILKQHPDISNGIFAHEDGHLIYNRNPEKYMAEAEKVGKAIEKSGLISQMNEHGAKIDEYFADKNSMDKVGYNATVRMLRSLIDPSRFEKTKKAIRKDPYCFVLSGLSRQSGQEILEKFGQDGMNLVGCFSAEWLYKSSIESSERMIKNKISLKREMLKDVTDKHKKDIINNYINEGIDRCKKDIFESKEKIAEIKESRRKIREKLSKELHNMQPDKEKLIQYLIEGTDKNEKENIVEMNFRIKMLDFWKDIDKDKSVKEGCEYMPLSEFNHYFQEAKMSSKTRNNLDDSDFALVYTESTGKKIRKYPINDEAHVKAAARMFPKGVPNKYRKEVAGKILRRAHKFGIDTSGWKSLNEANDKD